jgi:hypothetical protein
MLGVSQKQNFQKVISNSEKSFMLYISTNNCRRSNSQYENQEYKNNHCILRND